MTQWIKWSLSDEAIYRDDERMSNHQMDNILRRMKAEGVEPEAVIVIEPRYDRHRVMHEAVAYFNFTPDKDLKRIVWGVFKNSHNKLHGGTF